MSQINLKPEAISASITSKISKAIGITRYSQSSKMKLLADIFANEITNLADSYNTATEGLYSDTAEGQDLDIKGAEYGIYRKVRTSTYISKDDGIAIIREEVEGDSFGTTILEPFVIPRGERLTLGTNYFLIVAEDIYIDPVDYQVPISGTLISDDGSGFAIASGDIFKIESENRRDIRLNTLVAEFLKPITLEGGEESDDDFRERVKLARDGEDIATSQSVYLEVLSLPEIDGVTVLENKRGSGSLDIGVTTVTLQKDSVDPNIPSLLGLLDTNLLSVLPIGISLYIYEPDKLLLLIEFQTENELVSTLNINSAIKEAFSRIYTYNVINTISSSALEDEIHNILPEASIVITNMTLFDESINAAISISSDEVLAPLNYYIFLEKGSITREATDG